jgi:hypothetical protein
VTAVPLEAPVIDMGAVENDIAEVLAAHGVLAPGMRITAHLMLRGESPIGVSVQAIGRPATTRPHGREDEAFDAIVGQIREAS